ncbi:MAG: hypothetical protein WCJ84_02485 [Candidatus Peregrinibacteria bacterium]
MAIDKAKGLPALIGVGIMTIVPHLSLANDISEVKQGCNEQVTLATTVVNRITPDGTQCPSGQFAEVYKDDLKDNVIAGANAIKDPSITACRNRGYVDAENSSALDAAYTAANIRLKEYQKRCGNLF